MNYTLSEICKIQEWQFRGLKSSIGEHYRIVSIESQNKSIVVSFISCFDKHMDVKAEACEIMSRLFGDFKEDCPWYNSRPQFICAKALTFEGQELVSIISSWSAMESLCKGDSIAWLKSSIILDRTSESLLADSKLWISRLEKTIRKTITHVFSVNGVDWWQEVDANTRKQALTAYRGQGGPETNDPSVLIEFLTLPALRVIVCNNWLHFERIFGDRIGFDNDMKRLNEIRREESHNREITWNLHQELENIYERIMEAVGRLFPGLADDFLITQWRKALAKAASSLESELQKVRNSKMTTTEEKIGTFLVYRSAVTSMYTNVQDICAPPSKFGVHAEVVNLFAAVVSSVNGMLDSFPDLDAVEKYSSQHEDALRLMKDVTRRYVFSEC